ncbi:putative signal peptidase complex subunit 2, partial [Trichinella britovi]
LDCFELLAVRMSKNKKDDMPKTEKWDGNATRYAIDDAIRKIVIEKFGYSEDHRVVDCRLLLATLAVVLALFACVWDWFYPFPLSRDVLIYCSVSYPFNIS